MNASLFVLFVFCLTNMIFVEFTDENGEKSIHKFGSYEEAQLEQLIGRFYHSEDGKMVIPKKCEIMKISPNELMEYLKKFGRNADDIEDIKRLIKRKNDYLFANRKGAFLLIKIIGVAEELFVRAVQPPSSRDIPKLSVDDAYVMIHNLYDLIDERIRITHLVLLCINNGMFKLTDLMEKDKKVNSSDTMSSLFKTFIEDAENNVAYILKTDSGNTLNFPNRDGKYNIKPQLKIDGKHADIFPVVNKLSMEYDFLVNNIETIRNIIKIGNHVNDFMLDVYVVSRTSDCYKQNPDAVVENINSLLGENGHYKEVIISLWNVNNIYFSKIRANALVVKMEDCNESLLENLSDNVRELKIRKVKITTCLQISKNMKRLLLEDVMMDGSIVFAKDSKVKKLELNM